nr:serine-rich adhesin for platelets-like [Hydra vulgaris]
MNPFLKCMSIHKTNSDLYFKSESEQLIQNSHSFVEKNEPYSFDKIKITVIKDSIIKSEYHDSYVLLFKSGVSIVKITEKVVSDTTVVLNIDKPEIFKIIDCYAYPTNFNNDYKKTIISNSFNKKNTQNITNKRKHNATSLSFNSILNTVDYSNNNPYGSSISTPANKFAPKSINIIDKNIYSALNFVSDFTLNSNNYCLLNNVNNFTPTSNNESTFKPANIYDNPNSDSESIANNNYTSSSYSYNNSYKDSAPIFVIDSPNSVNDSTQNIANSSSPISLNESTQNIANSPSSKSVNNSTQIVVNSSSSNFANSSSTNSVNDSTQIVVNSSSTDSVNKSTQIVVNSSPTDSVNNSTQIVVNSSSTDSVNNSTQIVVNSSPTDSVNNSSTNSVNDSTQIVVNSSSTNSVNDSTQIVVNSSSTDSVNKSTQIVVNSSSTDSVNKSTQIVVNSSPTNSVNNSTQIVVNSSPTDSVNNSSTNSVNDSTQIVVNSSPTDSVNNSSTNSVNDSTQIVVNSSPTDSVNNSSTNSVNDSTQIVVNSSPTDSVNNSSTNSVNDSTQIVVNSSPTDSVNNSTQIVINSSPTDSVNNSTHIAVNSSSTDFVNDFTQIIVIGFSTDSVNDSTQIIANDSTQNIANSSSSNFVNSSSSISVNDSTHNIVNSFSSTSVNDSTHNIVNSSSSISVNDSTHNIVNSSSTDFVNDSTQIVVNSSSTDFVNDSTQIVVNSSSTDFVNDSTQIVVNSSSTDSVSDSTHFAVNSTSTDSVSDSTHFAVNSSSTDFVNDSTHIAVNSSSTDFVNDSTHIAVNSSSTDFVNDSTHIAVNGSSTDSVSDSTQIIVNGSSTDSVNNSTHIAVNGSSTDSVNNSTHIAVNGSSTDSVSDSTQIIVNGSSTDSVNNSTHIAVNSPSINSVNDFTQIIVNDSTQNIVNSFSINSVNDSTQNIVNSSSSTSVNSSSSTSVNSSSSTSVNDSTSKSFGNSTSISVNDSTHNIVNSFSSTSVNDSTHNIVDSSSINSVNDSTSKSSDISTSMSVNDTPMSVNDSITSSINGLSTNNVWKEIKNISQANEDSKHIKYKKMYRPNDIYYGIGIENETYLLSDKPIVRSGEWIINNRKRERYSVDYWTNFKSDDVSVALKLIDKKKMYDIPVFINSHAFTKCDRNNEHKTMYTKLTEPNMKFEGKTIHDIMMTNSKYYRDNNDIEFVYDGDTFEFTTIDFYNTTVNNCIKQLNDFKQRFLQEINRVFTEQSVLKGHYDNEIKYAVNYGFVNFTTNPRNIAICNNGTYHINITLPTKLDSKGKIQNIKSFKNVHSNAINALQWIEPLLVGCYGSPDILSVLNDKFSKGSQRLAISRYISVGTYDTNTMPEGKLLDTFEYDNDNGSENIGRWYKKYHKKSAYNAQKMIGLDVNYHKHYNHGIELRFFDYFPEEYLASVINTLLLVCQKSMLKKFPPVSGSECYDDQICKCVNDGFSATINKDYLLELAKLFDLTNEDICGHNILTLFQSIVNRLYKDIKWTYHPTYKLGIIGNSFKENEKRLPIHPADFSKIPKKYGSNIFIDKSYGKNFGYTDDQLKPFVGAILTKEEIYKSCDVLITLKFTEADYNIIGNDKICWGWHHLVQNKKNVDTIIKKGLTAISIEQMYENGRYILEDNRLIAGYSSVMHALQLKGLTGYLYLPEDQIRIAIISHGWVGRGAVDAFKALGFRHIDVYTKRSPNFVNDKKPGVNYLAYPENGKWKNVLKDYDIIVNCVLQDPLNIITFITKKDLDDFNKKMFIIDISCDTGMGFDFAVPTTFTEPILKITDNVDFYGVDHSPSVYYNTITQTISKKLLPYVYDVIDGKFEENSVLNNATEIKKGVIINDTINKFQKR